jgi:hypothetical protein
MSEVLNNKEVQKIYIDARGPRFGAAITTTVLAIALVTQSTWLLAAQGLVFLIGAVRGPQFTPYALIFKTLVKPRLKKEAPTEDVRPPKFAQAVGFAFALVGVVGAVAESGAVFTVAVGMALVLVLLMAVAGAVSGTVGCDKN